MFEIFMAVAKGKLADVRLQIKQAACCTIVLASKGYPDSFGRGYPIKGLNQVEKEDRVIVFHAGTKKEDSTFVTNGGRVLAVVSQAATRDEARAKVYSDVEKITFEGRQRRTDIAKLHFD